MQTSPPPAPVSIAPDAPPLSPWQQWLKDNLFFGNEPSLELTAILLVYFVQGVLGLARLAVSFFLKDDLGLSPAEAAALMGLSMLPWTIKPVFGFLSDGVPILGYRRRSYLILAGLLGMGSLVALGTVVDRPWSAALAITLSSLSLAISDVIADSLVVERVRNESLSTTGSLQSLCWGTAALGGLFTAYFSGYLLEVVSTQTVFLITAAFPLLVAIAAGIIQEEPSQTGISSAVVKNQLVLLKKALSQRAIWFPTLFLFLWQATPNSQSAFFYFTTNELGFKPEFLGRVQFVTKIAALVGIWLFNRYFKAVPFRKIFTWAAILSTLLGLSTLLLVTHANRSLGISDQWFSLGDSLVLTVAGEIAYMPVLVLAARLCPPGIEATLFALLMSVCNLSYLASTELGAVLTHWLGVTDTDFTNLWLLTLITTLSTLLPLPLVRFLPETTAQGTIPQLEEA
ncbi:MAG: folate/biopterin family MFS transporter [Prochlorothrix sp.]